MQRVRSRVRVTGWRALSNAAMESATRSFRGLCRELQASSGWRHRRGPAPLRGEEGEGSEGLVVVEPGQDYMVPWAVRSAVRDELHRLERRLKRL